MDHPFFVMMNTFLVAPGVVLMQRDGNRDLHLCAYYFKTFTFAKQNYDIYDHELLAVICTLEE